MSELTASDLMNALRAYAEADDSVYVGGDVRRLQLDGYFDMERLAGIIREQAEKPRP